MPPPNAEDPGRRRGLLNTAKCKKGDDTREEEDAAAKHRTPREEEGRSDSEKHLLVLEHSSHKALDGTLHLALQGSISNTRFGEEHQAAAVSSYLD